MSEHTPGPWRQFMTDNGYKVFAQQGDMSLLVADIRSGNFIDRDEAESNANIIASAPNLLAALDAALEHVRELREAWMTGALHECDGKGGTRSNRNVDVEHQLAATLKAAKGE